MDAENAFDTAAEAAEQELRELLKNLPPEQLKGAEVVIRWQRMNYMAAGHKRLGRVLVKLAKEHN